MAAVILTEGGARRRLTKKTRVAEMKYEPCPPLPYFNAEGQIIYNYRYEDEDRMALFWFEPRPFWRSWFKQCPIQEFNNPIRFNV